MPSATDVEPGLTQAGVGDSTGPKPTGLAALRLAWQKMRLTRWLATFGLGIGMMPYAQLRGWADDLGVPRQTLTVDLEALTTGGLTWSARLQDWFYSPEVLSPFDIFWVVIYGLWFPTAAIFAFYIAAFHWDRFRSFALVWFALLYVAVIPFALLPTEPPWLAYDVPRILLAAADGPLELDTNVVAAMPSLHVGLPAMIACWAWTARMRRIAMAFAVFSLLTAFSVVYLGEHYVLDTIAGAAFAWVVVRVSTRFAPLAPSEVNRDPVVLFDEGASERRRAA